MKSYPNSIKLNIPWLFKMAWRDAKASRVRLLLFMASIILGIAAVVAIQLFSSNLSDTIKKQSKSLMGADYIIDTRQEPTERARAIIDSLGPDAKEVNFVSMIAFPKNGGSKLVRVRGLEGDFPFYGEITTEPVSAAKTYQESGGALVDATLLLQFDVQPGDSIKVGEITLPIVAALKAIPGSSAVSTTVAPPVIIPYSFIDDTNLLQFGSRKEYQYFYKAPDTLDLEAFEDIIDPMLDLENADLDTHTSTSRRLGRSYENVGKFLNLAAFIALLLGCIGIASSVHIYIKEKLKAIAILKCMGTSRLQSFLIYLIQISGIGIIGGIIGSGIGVGLEELFPYIMQVFLSFDLEITLSARPIITGILLGFFMSVMFALLPLLYTWYVSPLKVLRVDEEAARPRGTRTLIFVIIFFSLFLFASWLLRDNTYALYFVLGAAITFGILAITANFGMKMVRRFFPRRWNYTARQGLLNLYRPNNQTVVLVLAIGLGTFLISTLYFTKDILLAKTEVGQTPENANIIILDVQTRQRQEVLEQLKQNDLPVVDDIPLVTMRMHSIKGRLVNDLRQDSTSKVRSWILNHEFRTTYRDKMIESEELVGGEWTPELGENDPVVISIANNLIDDARVNLGDTIVFNVQGVLMETTVGSVRQVDWGRLQPNFNIVFPAGVLENAPQFNVITTAAPDEQSSAKLQRELVARFPNVSVLDLRQVYVIIEDILDKVALVINFMAFFSIFTGLIVLIGSVRTSKYQRIKESVLLRTLGASNRQIVRIAALEYLFLGLLGSLVGILLALVGSFCLALFVFDESFTPSIMPFVVFLPGITLLVLAIGLSNIRGVLRSSPLEVLRREV